MAPMSVAMMTVVLTSVAMMSVVLTSVVLTSVAMMSVALMSVALMSAVAMDGALLRMGSRDCSAVDDVDYFKDALAPWGADCDFVAGFFCHEGAGDW